MQRETFLVMQLSAPPSPHHQPGLAGYERRKRCRRRRRFQKGLGNKTGWGKQEKVGGGACLKQEVENEETARNDCCNYGRI